MKYVNTPEDNYIACIGVPHSTALWQVGDSKGQHGSFNMAMTKAKQRLLEDKDTLGLQNYGIVDTNLMPLLLDTLLRPTMTSKEKTNDYSRSNQIIVPMKKQGTTESDSTTISASSMKSTITDASCNNLPKNQGD